MSSFTLTTQNVFPVDTVVGVYPGETVPTTGSPPAAFVTTGTMTADGVTFTGLAYETRYVAAAEVNGAWRYVRFATDPIPKGLPAGFGPLLPGDFSTEALEAIGPYAPQGEQGNTGSTGATGSTGPAGAGEYLTTSAGLSIGATTVTTTTAVPSSFRGYVAVDAFTANCEIRRVSSITGATATLTTALALAHSSAVTVLFFPGPDAFAHWFGCKGDGTDESAALQQALNESWGAGIGLDGSRRTYSVTIPMIVGSSSSISNLNFKAGGGFAPADTNGAMVMCSQGNIRSFTAAASTDVFTTSSSHGLPEDDVGVVFKGSSLPTGITAGRVYYARDRTGTTFKVAATPGGSAVDLTGDGSGTAYCAVLSLTKVHLRNIYINGSNIAGLNGMAAALQQQAFLDKLRIDNCPGCGLILSGQQAVFNNLELIHNGTALALDGAEFMWFWGFNAEDFDTAIHFRPSSDSIFLNSPAGGESCLWDGVHIEQSGVASAVCFDMEGGSQALDFRNLWITMNTSGQTIFHVHTGSANHSGYSIENCAVSGIASSGLIMIEEEDRGFTLDSWDDFRNRLRKFEAPLMPSSYLYEDHNPLMIGGPNGRYIKYGGTINSVPSMAFRPGASQTAAQTVWRNSSDADVSWFSKDGVFFTKRNTAPADGDLAANELAFWLDPTNGSAKAMFKAKQADGTVKTGSVNLT